MLHDFPSYDAKLLVEEEDPNLSGQHGSEHNLGPNPKIRNMSRAYREAKGDVVWIIDCNVWVSKSVAGLMVDRLCGLSAASPGKKYKFVHQLPLVVDVTSNTRMSTEGKTLNKPPNRQPGAIEAASTKLAAISGGFLDEMFLSTSHAKFYTAISAVAVAPCTVGKSNMFRRSHLDALTPSTDLSRRSAGIDFFSENICEDHLIGDLLWKTPVPSFVQRKAADEVGAAHRTHGDGSEKWGHHALVTTPPCIQPVANLPVSSYIARRARWLRVRKFTVPLATLVEPGTESLLCTGYGAFGLTTVPWCNRVLGIPRTWTAFWLLWFLGVALWAAVDYWVWNMLQQWAGEANEKATPAFVGSGSQRSFTGWLAAWLGREILAWPIWAWAVMGGTTVVWRDRKFWVGMDMRVHEIAEDDSTGRGPIGSFVDGAKRKAKNI